MKAFKDLAERSNKLYSDCLKRLVECVMAHNGAYHHDTDKFGPIYARCWNEDEDGIELYDIYAFKFDEEGFLIMIAESHNGNIYHPKGEKFIKYAADILPAYVISTIAEMSEPDIEHNHHSESVY